MKRSKVLFEDAQCASISISSSWKAAKNDKPKKSVSCQTSSEIFEFREMETQSGMSTDVIQDQVKEKYKGLSLLQHFAKKHKKVAIEQWQARIENGFISVDGERCIDPELKVDKDYVLEFTDVQSDASTQTIRFKFEEGKEAFQSDKVNNFLNKVSKNMISELENNLHCTAFDALEMRSSVQLESNSKDDEASYWKLLTVDLEKRRVLYPDWTKAKHYEGHITKCIVTRNKERIYDIEYEDGARLSGVREEYIRLLGGYATAAISSDKKAAAAASVVHRLQEGVRVHVKTTAKSGLIKYLPGRVTKSTRSATGGMNLFDVEVEGGKTETGRPAEDLIIGLTEGQQVEAKRPKKVTLQCTGVSWNATGNSLAASYGRNDILGWCDYPGAVCCWNVFGKNLTPDSPDFVLDHPSCLTCVAYHPAVPSLVAAGSFNGEVLVWDLSTSQQQSVSLQAYALSPIVEYAHKEPVSTVRWMYESTLASGSALGGSWLLVSAGADGKVLYWSMGNRFKHPVKGTMLSKHKTSSQRRHPACHGATAMAFSNFQDGAGGRASRPKWMLLGQEGGAIVRGQVSRILSGAALTQDSFKSQPPVEEVFPALRRDNFNHQPHIGAVSAMECSPFHRNVFLSSGADGAVKLFHVLEREPLRQWEPLWLQSASSGTGVFISALQFSPVRPSVFAAASSDGQLFLFDLVNSQFSPVKTLEAPLVSPLTTAGKETEGVSGGQKKSRGKATLSEGSGRSGLTGVAFNHKQRDLVAACDWLGRVHIWRLGWRLANRHKDDLSTLSDLAALAGVVEVAATTANEVRATGDEALTPVDHK